MDTAVEKVGILFKNIENERKTGRFIIVIDAFRGGIANLDIGVGERVPAGASLLMTKTGSFVVVPE